MCACVTSRQAVPSATLGFTPCGSPSKVTTHLMSGDMIRALDEADSSTSPATIIGLENTDCTNAYPHSDEHMVISSPKHRNHSAQYPVFRSCLVRINSSPDLGDDTRADFQMFSTSPPLETTQSETDTTPTRSCLVARKGLDARKTRRVRFSTSTPITFTILSSLEYDRSPHPVVPRLTYRDVLEMRELKIEISLVTKKQQALAGLVSDSLTSDNRIQTPAPVSGCNQDSEILSTPLDSPTSFLNDPKTNAIFSNPPSIAVASSFPSSEKLIARLYDMGEFCPPAQESGMGLKVEPSFGLDRVESGDSLHNDFKKHMLASSPCDGSLSSLRRKTSGDFTLEESEFQKELRKAREELEAIAVQEARLGLASQLAGGIKPTKSEQHSVTLGTTNGPHSWDRALRHSPSLSSESTGTRSRTSSHSSLRHAGASNSVFASDPSPARPPRSMSAHDATPTTHARSFAATNDEDEEGSCLFPNKRPSLPERASSFRPPSPILAPFARSTPIKSNSYQGSSPVSRSKDSIFHQQSPIMAPFTNS